MSCSIAKCAEIRAVHCFIIQLDLGTGLFSGVLYFVNTHYGDMYYFPQCLVTGKTA